MKVEKGSRDAKLFVLWDANQLLWSKQISVCNVFIIVWLLGIYLLLLHSLHKI